jgi:2-keto-3-deoxy-L-rhamnonate aldolase RhmA
MGVPKELGAPTPPEVEKVVASVLQACRASGKICGMMAGDGAKAAALVERGFQYVVIGGDVKALQSGLRSWMARFREQVAAAPAEARDPSGA